MGEPYGARRPHSGSHKPYILESGEKLRGFNVCYCNCQGEEHYVRSCRREREVSCTVTRRTEFRNKKIKAVWWLNHLMCKLWLFVILIKRVTQMWHVFNQSQHLLQVWYSNVVFWLVENGPHLGYLWVTLLMGIIVCTSGLKATFARVSELQRFYSHTVVNVQITC